jgi:PAS domain S-box-containing protein
MVIQPQFNSSQPASKTISGSGETDVANRTARLKTSLGAFEHEQQLRTEAETLNAVARDLHSNLDLQSVLQKVTDIGTRLTTAAFGAFFYNTINDQGEAFVLYTLSGAPRESFEKFGLPRNTAIFSPTFNGERVVRLDDVTQDTNYGKSAPHHGMPAGHLPVRSYLAVPVIGQDSKVIGGLFFGHPQVGVFDESAERVAQGIAIQAALAIENAKLYGKATDEIAKRVRVEKAFRESESRFEQLAMNAPVAIFVKDLEGRYTIANPLANQALGCENAVGKLDNELLDAASAERLRQNDLEVIRTGKPIESEERVQRGEFSQDYLAVKFPLFDSKEIIQGVCGVAVDVTLRRRAEDDLKIARTSSDRQQRLYETILSTTPDLVYVFDLNGYFTYANDALLQMWGRTWDDAIGKNCLELGYPAWHAAMHQREIEWVIANKQPIKGEVPFTGTHGTRIYEYIFVPVVDGTGEVEAIAGTTRDVTDRKEVEEAARKTQERYRQLVESLPAAVYTCDVHGRIELFNDAAVKLWGRKPILDQDRWCGSQAMFRADGNTLSHDDCAMAVTVRTGQPMVGEEVIVERPDGSRINVTSHPQLIFDDAGRPVGAINMLVDVTEQRRAEADRALMAAIVSSSDDAIISKTLDGIITSWNAGAERLFGYTPHEAIGQPILMLIPKERHDEELEIIERIRSGFSIEHFETERVAKNGKRLQLSITVSPVRDSQSRIIGASKVARDISERLLAAEVMRDSEERFRTLASNAPVGIFQTDLAGNTLFVNKAWCDLSGLQPSDASGDGWINAVHPLDRERVINDWQSAWSQGMPSHTEFRFRRPDGSIAWLQGSAEPLCDPQGKMLGYIGTVADITSRKLAEQALSDNEQRLAAELAGMNSLYNLTAQLLATEDLQSALQEVLTSAIALQRADMGCVHLYDAASDTFKVATQLGFEPNALETLSTFDPHSASGRALLTESRIVIEDVKLDPDYQHLLPFAKEAGYRAIQSTPLKSRGDVMLGILSTHFREPRQLESRELRMLDLYARQAADFIEQMQLIQSMREADHRKDEFLAMLAHELRNPLAPIRSGLDCLALENGEANESVTIMRDQVEHLVRLVDDLLDVSRIARGKVELRKEIVEVAPLVERAVEATAWSFKAKEQSLDISLPQEMICVDADPVRLVQVLGNLLNNASKYTPEGGHIELAVVSDGKEVILRVKDNGIGIERDLLPRVFDLFTQSSRALDRAQGGLGIGLTLVRSLVELHGGEIQAISEGIGKGSEFIITLPKSQLTPKPKTHSKLESSQSRRIVVVDDNYGAARLVSVLLKKLGDHEVEMAHDGPSALEKVKLLQPDIILLDIGLPGMDGYEVARQIRAADINQPLLVALTGYGRPEDQDESKAAGFDDHIVKPLAVDMLQRILAHPRLDSSLTASS